MLGRKKEKDLAVQEIERYEKRGFFMNYGKMAHKRFGFLVDKRLKNFEELHAPLRKGDIPLNLGAYASAMILTTIIAGIASFLRSEEHTSELKSRITISYAVSCLKKKTYYHLSSLATTTAHPSLAVGNVHASQ